jgi:site-specific DNA recombinase
VRLSRDTDESTSPARQRQAIGAFASMHGHTITYIAEDIDVSGSIAPADRPDLGPWLARMDEWDAIIVAKPDRLSRSLRDFLNLHHELEEHGKSIISIDPALDFSTDLGRLVATILLSFAGFERRIIAARVRDSYRHITQDGGYPGGAIPFGYLVRHRERGSGWEYAHDPDYVPVLREMVNRAIGGQSMRQIATWLTTEGVPTSQDLARRRAGKPERQTRWSVPSVKAVFTNPAIAGLQASGGRPLRDASGMIVQRCEGIITREEWGQLTAAIDRPAQGSHRVDANPMLRVAFCALDGQPLYATGNVGARRQYRYYICGGKIRNADCDSSRIPAEALEHLVELAFLGRVGDLEIVGRVLIPAEDHSAELAEVEEAIAHLDSEYDSGNLHARAYSRMVSQLEEKRDVLAALPVHPDRYKRVPSGETFRQRWDRSDAAGHRQLLIGAGFEIRAAMVGGKLTFAYRLDPELAARAQAAAAGEPVELPDHDAGQAAYKDSDLMQWANANAPQRPESEWTPEQRAQVEWIRAAEAEMADRGYKVTIVADTTQDPG